MLLFLFWVPCEKSFGDGELSGNQSPPDRQAVVTASTGQPCPLESPLPVHKVFLQLSDEAKGIVFAQLLDLAFFPEVFDADNPMSVEGIKINNDMLKSKNMQENKTYCIRVREYREGLLVGYLFALCLTVDEKKWESVLYVDPKLLSADPKLFSVAPKLFSKKEYNSVGIIHYLTGSIIGRGIGRSEISLLHSFHTSEWLYLYKGYLNGQEKAHDLIMAALDQIRKASKFHAQLAIEKSFSSDERYVDVKEIDEKEKESRLREVPAFEAMIFLKAMLIKKMKLDKNMIDKLIECGGVVVQEP